MELALFIEVDREARDIFFGRLWAARGGIGRSILESSTGRCKEFRRELVDGSEGGWIPALWLPLATHALVLCFGCWVSRSTGGDSICRDRIIGGTLAAGHQHEQIGFRVLSRVGWVVGGWACLYPVASKEC